MELSKIIRQIIKAWQIDLDFTDEEIEEVLAEMDSLSAVDKKELNKIVKVYEDMRYEEAFGEQIPMVFKMHLN